MRRPAQWEIAFLSKAHGIRKWTWLVWSLLLVFVAGLQIDTWIHDHSWKRAVLAGLLLASAVATYFESRTRRTASTDGQ